MEQTGNIVIKEVKTKRDLKKFVAFPSKLYKDSPYYVPSLFSDEYDTLRSDKNPAFEYCETKMFLAYKDGKIVGRVCALNNKRYNEVWKCNRARFTRFDFIDDIEVSRALMNEVEKYARENNHTEVHGPMGFCDMDKQGMLVEGFEEIDMFITTYNYDYYIKHLEALGYGKAVDWIEFLINVPEELDERYFRISKIILRRYKLERVKINKMKEILPLVDKVFKLLEDAYKDLYGVIPLNERQIQAYVKQFITLLTPDDISLIVDSNGDPVAVGICLPSIIHAVRKTKGRLFPFGFISLLKALKSKTVDRYEFLLIGVKPELQKKGLTSLIIIDFFNSFRKQNVKFTESGPMLETNNDIHSVWEEFDLRQHKRRRCYIKELD